MDKNVEKKNRLRKQLLKSSAGLLNSGAGADNESSRKAMMKFLVPSFDKSTKKVVARKSIVQWKMRVDSQVMANVDEKALNEVRVRHMKRVMDEVFE